MTRCLTVRQPFASRIVHGTKTIENRSRATSVRGRILIHAGAQTHDLFAGMPMTHLPSSALIGTAQLVGCHPSTECGDRCSDGGGFRTGEYPLGVPGSPRPASIPEVWWHWEFTDAVAFDDSDVVRGVRGALGFWEPDARGEHLATIARAAQIQVFS